MSLSEPTRQRPTNSLCLSRISVMALRLFISASLSYSKWVAKGCKLSFFRVKPTSPIANSFPIIFLVKLNVNVKRSASQPSLFKPTGACWKSSGTSRKRSEPAYWSRGYSVVTLPGYESMGRSKTGIRLGRWPTMHKWRLLFKNCKFKTDPIVCRIASRVADRHHWEF